MVPCGSYYGVRGRVKLILVIDRFRNPLFVIQVS
jgi:hypothetical protein